MLKQLLSLFVFTLLVNIGFAQSPYCNTEVTHFAGDPGSEVFLTISNIDATSMYVEIESANADAVDLLIVVGGSGAAISAEDTSVPGKIRRTLTWGSPPADVFLNVLWSKASFGGNWQLATADISIPFSANCSTAPASAYCSTQVTHFAGDAGSEVFLTISNIDANSMYVEVESANADAVDLLIVVGGSGAAISAEDTSVPGKIRRTLTWGSPPADVSLNVLWSKVSFGGNWQLSTVDIMVPFAANCTTTPSIPTMGEWALFILFLLIVNIAAVFIFATQNQLALATENQTISMTSVLGSLPFDQSSFIHAMKHAFGIALVGFALIYIFWGEIIAADFIGMAISIPLIAYFIHLIIGKKE